MHLAVDDFLEAVNLRLPAVQAVRSFIGTGFDSNAYSAIMEKIAALPQEERMRVYSYASLAASGDIKEQLLDNTFRCVRSLLLSTTTHNGWYATGETLTTKEYTCSEYPLRVNWCGTWTDTPPYCLENGGAVVNAAITLNDQFPVKVTIKKIEDAKAILEYFDSGYRGEFYKVAELTDCGNPSDPFLLLKSALVACGFVPLQHETTQKTVFELLGGGIHLSAGVSGVPKGSGLGTSSILLAACIKGLMDYVNLPMDDTELYQRVLLAEQIMCTGGGWQDQAGGLTRGIKLITSAPGLTQRLQVEHLSPPNNFLSALRDRFCLVYSGQRRLGRTILREMMSGYLQNDPLFVETLRRFFSLASDMRQSVEAGDMDGFIDCLNTQTSLTRKLCTGYTNELIDNILLVCKEITDAHMMCGAGGGGFIQLILKSGYDRHDLQKLLRSAFPQQGIDVWNSNFV